jgi:hypothetical protein
VQITGYDHATGTLTVSPQAVVAGHPELSIHAGDVVVIRNTPDVPNTNDPTQITDSGYQNVTCDYSGLTPGVEVGNILRVIQGTGRGQLRKITGNTPTQLSWDLPLVLDETSVWIVEDAAWSYIVDSSDVDNANYQLATSLTLPSTNFLDFSMVVGGFTVNSAGVESSDASAPIREIFIYGDGYAQAFIAAATYAMKANDHVLTFTGVNQTLNLLPSNAIRRFPRYIIHAGTGSLTVNPAPGDTVEGLASGTLNPGDRMVLMPSS